MSRPRVVLCGVGALGSHLALFARNLDCAWVFVDHDRVEGKNLLAQAYVAPSAGKLKAQALALQLRNFYRTSAEARPVRFGEHNAEALLSGAALAVDCFDNAASRRALASACQSLGIPLVHGALAGDGSCGLVRWDERFEPDEEPEGEANATCAGGEHLPLIALAAATLARAVQDFLAEGVRRDAWVTREGVLPQGTAGAVSAT